MPKFLCILRPFTGVLARGGLDVAKTRWQAPRDLALAGDVDVRARQLQGRCAPARSRLALPYKQEDNSLKRPSDPCPACDGGGHGRCGREGGRWAGRRAIGCGRAPRRPLGQTRHQSGQALDRAHRSAARSNRGWQAIGFPPKFSKATLSAPKNVGRRGRPHRLTRVYIKACEGGDPVRSKRQPIIWRQLHVCPRHPGTRPRSRPRDPPAPWGATARSVLLTLLARPSDDDDRSPTGRGWLRAEP